MKRSTAKSNHYFSMQPAQLWLIQSYDHPGCRLGLGEWTFIALPMHYCSTEAGHSLVLCPVLCGLWLSPQAVIQNRRLDSIDAVSSASLKAVSVLLPSFARKPSKQHAALSLRLTRWRSLLAHCTPLLFFSLLLRSTEKFSWWIFSCSFRSLIFLWDTQLPLPGTYGLTGNSLFVIPLLEHSVSDCYLLLAAENENTWKKVCLKH